MKNRIVIYHGNCMDGFTSAWVCWKKFGDTAEYIPATYGDAPPDVLGRHVVIADFSYDRDIMERMNREAKSLIVFDHHKTAEKRLEGLDYCVFDMHRSGAGITWDELFPVENRPWLVNYIEDRDLWKFNLIDSHQANSYIQTVKFDFEEYDKLNELGVDGAIKLGEGCLRQVNFFVREMSKQARILPFEGHTIPVVNAPYINTSELVGNLAKKGEFALGWFQRKDGMFQYSLRSRNEFDVSEIALKYGGGGHKNASGFVSEHPFDELVKTGVTVTWRERIRSGCLKIRKLLIRLVA